MRYFAAAAPTVTPARADSLRSSPTSAEQAVAVLRVIEEQGLQPQPAPEPLPEITTDDVHLVCWQALTTPP